MTLATLTATSPIRLLSEVSQQKERCNINNKRRVQLPDVITLARRPTLARRSPSLARRPPLVRRPSLA